jgi:hypothetical protein
MKKLISIKNILLHFLTKKEKIQKILKKMEKYTLFYDFIRFKINKLNAYLWSALCWIFVSGKLSEVS